MKILAVLDGRTELISGLTIGGKTIARTSEHTATPAETHAPARGSRGKARPRSRENATHPNRTAAT